MGCETRPMLMGTLLFVTGAMSSGGFHEGRYRRLSPDELQAIVTEFIREEFQRTKPTTKHGQILQVTRNVVGNVMHALKGKLLVDSHLEQPIWLGNGQAGPFCVFANGMVNVDDLMRAKAREEGGSNGWREARRHSCATPHVLLSFGHARRSRKGDSGISWAPGSQHDRAVYALEFSGPECSDSSP